MSTPYFRKFVPLARLAPPQGRGLSRSERQPTLGRQKPPAATLYPRHADLRLMNETLSQAAWQQWLDQHGPGLLLFARQQTAGEADAQDLVQEAVVEGWQRQGAGGPPDLPLVFATIRRRAVDLARRRERRAQREHAALAEPSAAWFDPEIEAREMNQMIQQALAQLPAPQREVITLKVWGGLTFAEIAATLDIPPNTAASRYRYGLEELRRLTKEVLA